MLKSAFKLGEEIKLRSITYKLFQDLWFRYDLSKIDLNWKNWKTIKYLDDEMTEFNEDISKVPNNLGGIYMFLIKCPIIPGLTEFPMYIGRAQLTKNQNLRKRCKEYLNEYKLDRERAKLTFLFEYWPKEIYLAYLPIGENTEVRDYEKKLINSLLLPLNDKIPDIEIRQGVKAFQQ